MQSSEASISCVLPFEIVEIIIDLLAEKSDTDSLKAISLVCRSVLPRCRKYLFSDLKIDVDMFNFIERCRMLLSPQTDIPKYIRRLEYSITMMPFFDPASLERISSLQSLIIRYSDGPATFDWIQINLSLRSAFLNLIRLPTLTHLHLIHIDNFPVFALSSCASLKHLELDFVGVTDESSCTLFPSGSDIFTVPKIQEYTFRRSAITTMRLLTAKFVDGRVALDFTNLKILSVDFELAEDIEATRSLLKELKQVEELRVAVTDDDPARLTGLADMAFHTVGRTLCLSLGAWNFKTPHGIFLGLCNELSAMMTTNNTLKTLRLEINAVTTDLGISSSGEWKKLDAVLSSRGWASLEHVFLDITTCDYRGTGEELELLTDLPNTQLTRLSSKASLNFNFSVLLENVLEPDQHVILFKRHFVDLNTDEDGVEAIRSLLKEFKTGASG